MATRDIDQVLDNISGIVVNAHMDDDRSNFNLSEYRQQALSELNDLLLEIHKDQEDIIGAYKDYIELLTDELNEVVQIAAIHGWKSERFEAGKEAREKINDLENKYVFKPPSE